MTIPVRKPPDYAEYWRVKGDGRGGIKVLCCMCHVIFGFPDDGWEVHADGRRVMAASVPEARNYGAVPVNLGILTGKIK